MLRVSGRGDSQEEKKTGVLYGASLAILGYAGSSIAKRILRVTGGDLETGEQQKSRGGPYWLARYVVME